jgi:hypothetical protein
LPKRDGGCTLVTVASLPWLRWKRCRSDRGRVGDAVAVGEQEGAVLEPAAQPLEAAAGLGVEARVDQVHLPVGLLPLVDRRLAGREVDGDVVVDGVEVEEVLLDVVAPVAERDHELLDPVGVEDLHDVPEHGVPPTVTMGLGLSIVSSDSRVPKPPARITAFTVVASSWGRARRLRASLVDGA